MPVAVGLSEVQLAVPHTQPEGQQLPPTLEAQVDHPVAQSPVGVATVAADPTGTTIVWPLEMIVVEEVTGQDSFAQSRLI
jgi:hypothetical protein